MFVTLTHPDGSLTKNAGIGLTWVPVISKSSASIGASVNRRRRKSCARATCDPHPSDCSSDGCRFPANRRQAAMRHSSIDLTMNVYTDPKLLDVNGALDALPALPIDQGDGSEREAATGTDGATRKFAPGFAPKTDKPGESRSIVDKAATLDEGDGDEQANVVSLSAATENSRSKGLATAVRQERARGFEPPTYSLGSCHSAN